jgi:ribonuclease PH
VALVDALDNLLAQGHITENPLQEMIASISVGIHNGVPVLDLDYEEDSQAQTDMNVVMNGSGGFIEIQGTAEGAAFRESEFLTMLNLAKKGIGELLKIQQITLSGDR